MNTTDKFASTAKVLAGFAQVGVAVLGALPFLYLFGWIRAKSYFQTIGATWMLGHLTPLYFLAHNDGELLIFGMVVALGFFAEALPATPTPPRRRWELTKTWKKVLTGLFFVLAAIPFGLLLLAAATRSDLDALAMAGKASLAFIVFLGFLTVVIVIAMRDRAEKLFASISGTALLMFAVVFVDFIIVPAMLGRAEALVNIGKSSLLPLATLPDGTKGRLLHSTDSHLFILDPQPQGMGIKIAESANARVAPEVSPSPSVTRHPALLKPDRDSPVTPTPGSRFNGSPVPRAL